MLEPIGHEDATAMGKAMAARGWLPSLVLCSTGVRAKQTWEAAQVHAGHTRTEMTERLYNADAAGYLDIIRQSGTTGSLMLVGHNPMIEDVALALSGKKDPLAERIRKSGFPTAGLAVIEFDETAEQVAPGKGRMIDFIKPADR